MVKIIKTFKITADFISDGERGKKTKNNNNKKTWAKVIYKKARTAHQELCTIYTHTCRDTRMYMELV